MITDIHQFENVFLSEARDMWGNVIDKISFKFLVSESPPEAASLTYSGKPRAIGNSLYSFPPHMTSRVKQKFFSMPEDQQRKIIIHEVGHIGYANHDANFRRIVEEHGGIVSINQLEGGGYKVQKKSGSRFETVKKFENMEEAQEYAKMLVKNPGNRVRIIY